MSASSGERRFSFLAQLQLDLDDRHNMSNAVAFPRGAVRVTAMSAEKRRREGANTLFSTRTLSRCPASYLYPLMADQLLHIDTGARIDLVEFNMLGRAVDATIPLEDASVSRQHASIRRQGKEYWLTDLGSSNYTYLNGLVVRTPQKIVPGDRLRFGSVEFEFVSGDPGEISDQLEGRHVSDTGAHPF